MSVETAWLAIVVLIASLMVSALALVIRNSNRRVGIRDAEIHFRDELFSMLADRSDDIFIVISSDGYNVEYVSPNIERLLGVDVEDAKSDLYSIQKPTYFDGTLPTRDNLLAIPLGGMTARESVRTNTASGEEIVFLETTYHMMIDGIDRFVAVLSDRTEERNQRAALEEALASAEAASHAKSAFLSNISHDIRTPMNAIVGLAELLESDIENTDAARREAANIKAASNHLLGLINDVLDMSKIESGSTVLNLAEFNLEKAIEEISRVVHQQAEAKSQAFRVHIDGNVPKSFVGDEVRISQILLNILSNAVKYTPVEGQVSFDVSLIKPVASKGGIAKLRFVVSDNGIGMTKDFIDKIFDPFTREIQSVSNEVQGTGLGMPIAKSLVDLMGGSITIDSEPGKGTVFTVDLALKAAEKVVAEGGHKSSIDIAGMHFLIAEDVDINAEVIEALLGNRNATCDVAENGKVAFEMFRDRPEGTYDAILMDVQMPVMDGYEATRMIRGLDRRDAARIPIIAMTANAFMEDVNNAIAAGMNAHLAKPATMKQLSETLGSIM